MNAEPTMPLQTDRDVEVEAGHDRAASDVASDGASENTAGVAGVQTGLVVSGLTVRFRTRYGTVAALSDVSLRVPAGTVRTVVGESGSGKSVLAHALLGLLPANVAVAGTAHLDGRELVSADDALRRRLRSRQVAFVPQSPATALNPVRRLGPLLAEFAAAKGIPRAAVEGHLRSALGSLGLDYAEIASRYPHQLSGGMQQRVLTALALLGSPSLVVADEPTSGLDADRVADTAAQLRHHADKGASVLVITHDLALAENLGGRLALLYAGHLVEERPSDAFFAQPAHPYSRGLLAARPEWGGEPIAGMPPELTALPPGCPFAPRCPQFENRCDTGLPVPVPVSDVSMSAVSVSAGNSTGDGDGHVRCLRHVDG